MNNPSGSGTEFKRYETPSTCLTAPINAIIACHGENKSIRDTSFPLETRFFRFARLERVDKNSSRNEV